MSQEALITRIMNTSEDHPINNEGLHERGSHVTQDIEDVPSVVRLISPGLWIAWLSALRWPAR
jgi:hypothetical protein